MLPASKCSNSIPQSRRHPTSKHKCCIDKPSEPVALEQYHQRPSDLSTQQTPLPLTRKQHLNNELQDAKLECLHSDGVLNRKAECSGGSSGQDVIGNVTSHLPMTTLQRSTNEIPLHVQFKNWKFERSCRQPDLQSDSLTQQTSLPLHITKLKRTRSELPEDIMQRILQEMNSDQQKEDHLQRSTHSYPN